MRGMLRRLLGLCACAASLAAFGGLALLAMPAGARARPVRIVGYAPTGSLTFSWQAESSLGCAAEGLCGVVGSIALHFGQYSTGSSQSNPPVDLQDDGAVARSVQITPSGQSQQACADPESVDMEVTIVGTGSTRRALAPRGEQFAPFPSAGTCAGPTQEDLTHFVLPVRSLGRRGYEIAGSDSYAAGPFEVTVNAHVDAAFARFTSVRGPVPLPVRSPKPTTRTRHVLQEMASMTYRLRDVQGSLGASFTGGPDAFCQGFGTCGARGSVSLALATQGETVTIAGVRSVRRRIGKRAALRDLEAGRLQVGGVYGETGSATVTGTLQAADGFDCSDETTDADSLPLQASVHDRVLLVRLGTDLLYAGEDPMRTRCPGPAGSDIVGSGSLASARLPLDELGSPTITLELTAGGGFSGEGYVGTRDGSMTLTFGRAAESGGTRRITVVGVRR